MLYLVEIAYIRDRIWGAMAGGRHFWQPLLEPANNLFSLME
ncbi:hypothetical protein Ga0080559_TMP4040 [Salipiger profundus]|uniref:Uncharacterized protein n=1 Tax=Salipiger profundus TaxID=1229727 RepID=A0A1U7D9U2_9RHOB|nr:hypothetical protein Ga0080559_TMP4040 [Salipiger profundus]